MEYLQNSVEILCKNYGEIGGFWFDRSWYKEKIDWQFDKLFGIIQKYQPNATISNNGGLECGGEVVNSMIDCLIYERGVDFPKKKSSEKNLAREVCQTLNEHWGYFVGDDNYKSEDELVSLYKNCQNIGANLLLNVGPLPNGKIDLRQKNILKNFGEILKTI